MTTNLEYEANFAPLLWQSEILLDESKVKVVLASRQIGKTVLLRQMIYLLLLSEPNTEILYLATTISQSKELCWRHLCETNPSIFHERLIRHKDNQNRILTLVNGSRITVTGTDNKAALLGRSVNIVLVDEYQDQPSDLFQIIQPMLAAKMGKLVLVGTVRSAQNQMWQAYLKSQNTEGWKGWRIPIYDAVGAPSNNEESIALAKATLSKEEFEMEYLAIPHQNEGAVYPGFSDANVFDDRDEILVMSKLKDRVLSIGLDFNISKMSAIIGVKDGNNFYIVDEIVQEHNGANTASMINELNRRYSGYKKIIYPDASGRNRSTNTVDPNNTNHQMLRQAGFNLVFSHSGNPPIVDRIMLLNGKIRPFEGEPTFFVHRKCRNVIDSLSNRVYVNEKPDKHGGFDHTADATEYAVWHLFSNQNTITQRSAFGQRPKGLVDGLVKGFGTG